MNSTKIAILSILSIALIALLGCVEEGACTEEAKVCPDGSTVGRNPALNCEFDPCPECVGEGGTIPVIAEPPECCAGLTLIPPKEEMILGISGICTANCGNGACDMETESSFNCPVDCPQAEQVVGPEAYANEGEAFGALEQELEGLPEPSLEELEGLIGE
ncbi:MAG: hypothetical protein JW744_00670 [Candidatus Diapherotrites archaeon]|uniref:Uncharacterized protein n=1 Tax=Candidatus Iainarchaeum sp. TaxID=3101447 RepID=A0A939C6T8_9ARCH|nr:hypothetical protein [Candidatus Diapherotrites archaeon]